MFWKIEVLYSVIGLQIEVGGGESDKQDGDEDRVDGDSAWRVKITTKNCEKKPQTM